MPRLRRFLYSLGPVLTIAAHLGCLLLFWTGLSLGAALWALGLYLVRMLATTAIYHRLITHSSYKASRPVAWIGAFVGGLRQVKWALAGGKPTTKPITATSTLAPTPIPPLLLQRDGEACGAPRLVGCCPRVFSPQPCRPMWRPIPYCA